MAYSYIENYQEILVTFLFYFILECQSPTTDQQPVKYADPKYTEKSSAYTSQYGTSNRYQYYGKPG